MAASLNGKNELDCLRIIAGQILAGGGSSTLYFTPEAYGAVHDGTTDDTVALQACITAAEAVGGVMQLSLGTYKITDTLVINNHMSIMGVTSLLFSGTLTASSGESINLPGISPYIGGSVLKMATAAKNAINITVPGQSVPIENLSVIFGDLGDSVQFNNTGHGIYCVPTGTYTTGGHTYGENGIQYSRWKNIAIWGVDGTHYCIYMSNSLYNVGENWFLVGGGAFLFDNNSFSYCGNMTINGGWFWMVVQGTSHGIYLKNTSHSLSGTGCDHIVFLNCQVLPQAISGVAGPGTGGSTQRLLKMEDGCQFLSFKGCSFESVGFNCYVDWPDRIEGITTDTMSVVQGNVAWSRNVDINGNATGSAPVVINTSLSWGRQSQNNPSYRMVGLFDYPANPYTDSTAYYAGYGFDGHSLTYAVQTGDGQAKHRFGSLDTTGAVFTDWFNIYNGAYRLPSVAVSALPGTPVTDMIALVNDALAPVKGATVAGSGSVRQLVVWDGGNWKVL